MSFKLIKSALDVNVAKEIVEKCFFGLLKDKTRILFTNSMRFLEGVDKVIILNGGKVEKYGTY